MAFKPEEVYSKYSYAGQDEEYFDDVEATAQLLREGICFVGYSGGAQLVVFCSDVFAWAVADAEEIKDEKEMEELYKWCVKYPNYGGVIWCCIKRNEKPQAPFAKLMKDDNQWDISLDKLPENKYDVSLKNQVVYENGKATPINSDEANA